MIKDDFLYMLREMRRAARRGVRRLREMLEARVRATETFPRTRPLKMPVDFKSRDARRGLRYEIASAAPAQVVVTVIVAALLIAAVVSMLRGWSGGLP